MDKMRFIKEKIAIVWGKNVIEYNRNSTGKNGCKRIRILGHFMKRKNIMLDKKLDE